MARSSAPQRKRNTASASSSSSTAAAAAPHSQQEETHSHTHTQKQVQQELLRMSSELDAELRRQREMERREMAHTLTHSLTEAFIFENAHAQHTTHTQQPQSAHYFSTHPADPYPLNSLDAAHTVNAVSDHGFAFIGNSAVLNSYNSFNADRAEQQFPGQINHTRVPSHPVDAGFNYETMDDDYYEDFVPINANLNINSDTNNANAKGSMQEALETPLALFSDDYLDDALGLLLEPPETHTSPQVPTFAQNHSHSFAQTHAFAAPHNMQMPHNGIIQHNVLAHQFIAPHNSLPTHDVFVQHNIFSQRNDFRVEHTLAPHNALTQLPLSVPAMPTLPVDLGMTHTQTHAYTQPQTHVLTHPFMQTHSQMLPRPANLPCKDAQETASSPVPVCVPVSMPVEKRKTAIAGTEKAPKKKRSTTPTEKAEKPRAKKKEKAEKVQRGNYKCGRCGQPKVDHVCSVVEKLCTQKAVQTSKVHNPFRQEAPEGERVIVVGAKKMPSSAKTLPRSLSRTVSPAPARVPSLTKSAVSLAALPPNGGSSSLPPTPHNALSLAAPPKNEGECAPFMSESSERDVVDGAAAPHITHRAT